MKSSFHVKLFVTIAIHIIVTINLTDGYIDLRQLAAPLTDDEKCKAAGPIGLACKSCLEIGRCLCSNPEDCNNGTGWSIISISKCPTGRTCDKGKCVTNQMCVPTDATEFVCTSTGMFPDPYDCTKYYFCTPGASATSTPTATRATCETDGAQVYGYNALTAFCSTRLLNNKCTTLPVPLCKKPFDTGIVGNNPSLYYLCVNVTEGATVTDVLHPYQYKCPFGRRYNVVTQECR